MNPSLASTNRAARLPSVSVAICTKDRPESLRRCLDSLEPLRPQLLEIVVIDNNSKDGETERIARSYRVRYAKETKRGRSAARNCAIRNSSGEILAYTDDDCEVDPGWVEALRESFSDPAVGCVTGKAISPPEGTRIQMEFEIYANANWPERAYQVSPDKHPRIYFEAFAGVGANMAFRRGALIRSGGFLEELRSCGEDDYAFFSVLHSGFKLQYNPASLVRQHHRDRLPHTLWRLVEYGHADMRVVWFASAQLRSIRLLMLNIGWLFRGKMRRCLSSLARGRFLHALFGLCQLLGCAAGLCHSADFLVRWRRAPAPARDR